MPVSSNTKAILMLTAPLIIGRERSAVELLTHGEYNRLARFLVENRHEPADLLGPEVEELSDKLQSVIDKPRLLGLLKRGFLLSQAIEKWQSRSIWVVSRADADYPKRLRERLKDAAPVLLYGCGENTLVETGGLAVVGSRNVDEKLIEYTENVGHRAADFQVTVISGGARGIDRAAMFGSLQAGGRAIGVLADSLERMALARDNREYLMEKRLVLISPYDPAAGFDVGNAMQRNKVIYALSDAALVVNADYEKGGTWSGAVEQLEKLHLVPVYVRSDENDGKGLKALQQKGALTWPDPKSQEEFMKALAVPASPVKVNSLQKELPLATAEDKPDQILQSQYVREKVLSELSDESSRYHIASITPADELFSKVKEIVLRMKMPKTEIEVAEALQVSQSQTKEWLHRLVDEGVLKKQRKPPGYVFAAERQEKLIKNI